MNRLICAPTALLIALSACGGGSSPPAGLGASSSTQTTPGATIATKSGSTTPGSPTGSGTASPKQSGAASLPPNTQDHVPGTQKAPLEVTMGSACVVRGTVQRITIKSTPGFQLSWATVYADGKTHQEYNGWAITQVPPTGTYTSAWTIPANGPLGDARSDVSVAGKSNGKDSTAFGHGYFKIATSC